jgi:hypothetical protein
MGSFGRDVSSPKLTPNLRYIPMVKVNLTIGVFFVQSFKKVSLKRKLMFRGYHNSHS